jgi:hypothetical protein
MNVTRVTQVYDTLASNKTTASGKGKGKVLPRTGLEGPEGE